MNADVLQIRDALAYRCEQLEIVVNERRLHGFAEEVYAIGVDHLVPVEEAICWISSGSFSLQIADWVHHCAEYVEFQKQYCIPPLSVQ